jgi:hypothetical protein
VGRRGGRAGRRRRVLRPGRAAPSTLAAPNWSRYQGWLRVPDASPPRPGVPLFQAGATHPAILRFSRGAGLPEPLPDALGVAIKLPDAHSPGVDQDLLLTSSTDRPLLRRLLFPARSFARGAYSTALPYDLGSERVVLLLIPNPTSDGRSTGGIGHRPTGALAELRAIAAGLEFELRAAKVLGPIPAASHRDSGSAALGRPDRGAALQPLDHRTWHPPLRLAEPAPRRRLPGKPTRPSPSNAPRPAAAHPRAGVVIG